jgi:uncharacterized membrane protein
MSSLPALTLLYVLLGLVMVGLAVPLIARWVAPNDLYGFRVEKTLDDPAVWYPANAFAGWCLVGAGVLVAGAALVLRRWSPGLGATRYTLICSLVLIGSVSVAALLSFLYLRSLPDPS